MALETPSKGVKRTFGFRGVDDVEELVMPNWARRLNTYFLEINNTHQSGMRSQDQGNN